MGVLPGIIGSIQAVETIKWILGIGESLVGRLLLFDALKLEFRELALAKDPACPVCGVHPTVTSLIDYEAFCGVTAEKEKQVGAEITPRELRNQRERDLGLMVLDVREPQEIEIAAFPGATEIPLGDLPGRIGELDGHRTIVTLCHHGIRSLRARDILKGAGFSNVRSLAGGIDAWSREVDPAVPRY